MIFVLRIGYPIFSWLVLLLYGIEAIDSGHLLKITTVGLALAGLAQTFWRSQVIRKRPYEKGDIIALMLGGLSAVVYVGLALWKAVNNFFIQ